MEQPSTKQRIMQEALALFAENGYEAVSVAQIANAVGVKAPSLYKHFKSKQDIFDAILLEMRGRYEKQAASLQMNGMEADRDIALFLNIDEQQLIEMGRSLFLYFLHDTYESRFRRMLTIEQFHSRDLSNLYAKQYLDEPLSYQGLSFGLMMQAGSLEPDDPQLLALHFYAPLFLLLTLCDCHPEREEEALQLVERHIRQFNRLYRKKEN